MAKQEELRSLNWDIINRLGWVLSGWVNNNAPRQVMNSERQCKLIDNILESMHNSLLPETIAALNTLKLNPDMRADNDKRERLRSATFIKGNKSSDDTVGYIIEHILWLKESYNRNIAAL